MNKYTRFDQDKKTIFVEWKNMLPGELGTPFPQVDWALQSIAVRGKLSGARVLIEGSNDYTPPVFFDVLGDSLDNPLVFSVPGIKNVGTKCFLFRPVINGGTSETDITVTALLKSA